MDFKRTGTVLDVIKENEEIVRGRIDEFIELKECIAMLELPEEKRREVVDALARVTIKSALLACGLRTHSLNREIMMTVHGMMHKGEDYMIFEPVIKLAEMVPSFEKLHSKEDEAKYDKKYFEEKKANIKAIVAKEK